MKRLLSILILGLLACTAWSQTGLTLYTLTGSQHYSIESSGAIYITDDQLEIRENLNNGAHDVYNMEQVTKIIFDEPLSIDEMEQQEVSIYPNPATNSIRINGIRDSRIEILDMLGKVVLTKVAEEGTSVDVSKLLPGVYIVRTDNKLMKFIKR